MKKLILAYYKIKIQYLNIKKANNFFEKNQQKGIFYKLFNPKILFTKQDIKNDNMWEKPFLDELTKKALLKNKNSRCFKNK